MTSDQGKVLEVGQIEWATMTGYSSFTVDISKWAYDVRYLEKGVFLVEALRVQPPSKQLVDLSFELPLCWIEQSNHMFKVNGLQPPFYVDNSRNDATLTINLYPYSVNDQEKCGKLVFTARSEHKDNNGEPFDVFATGSAEVDGSDLVFRNATSYPRGNLEVFASIAHEF